MRKMLWLLIGFFIGTGLLFFITQEDTKMIQGVWKKDDGFIMTFKDKGVAILGNHGIADDEIKYSLKKSKAAEREYYLDLIMDKDTTYHYIITFDDDFKSFYMTDEKGIQEYQVRKM